MLKNWLPTHVSTTQLVTRMGMLIALNLVLNQVAIPLGTELEISFASIPFAIMGAMFGPIVAAIGAGFADIIGFFLRPNGFFFPGFTLNAMVIAAIYGFFLYRKPFSVWRTVLATIVSKIMADFILTPVWLQIMYQNNFFTYARFVRTMIVGPIEGFILVLVMRFLENIGIGRKSIA